MAELCAFSTYLLGPAICRQLCPLFPSFYLLQHVLGSPQQHNRESPCQLSRKGQPKAGPAHRVW